MNKKMKEFKPKFYEVVHMIIPENSNDIFIDAQMLEDYRKNPKTHWDVSGYEGIVLGLGINAFIFDVNSCKFFIIEK